jgi:hypothetical protein
LSRSILFFRQNFQSRNEQSGSTRLRSGIVTSRVPSSDAFEWTWLSGLQINHA